MAERLPAHRGGVPVGAAPVRGLPNLMRHLEPERLVKRHGEAISRMATRWINADYLVHEIRRSQRDREDFRRDLTTCPSVGDLVAVSEDIGSALALTPDRQATQAALAVMFDSRVRGPQNPEIYLEALVYDLVDEGFPPAVVVGACQTLRRESKFTPEIAEVIAACRAKLASYRAVANLAGRLSDTRSRVEEALQAADDAVALEADRRSAAQPIDLNADPGDGGW